MPETGSLSRADFYLPEVKGADCMSAASDKQLLLNPPFYTWYLANRKFSVYVDK